MSWLQTPECLPDDVNQELVRMSQMGGSEQNAIIECICDALSSLGENEDGVEHALGMIDEFLDRSYQLKTFFKERRP